MAVNEIPLNIAHSSDMLAIESACHEYGWTEKTIQSCFGQRYFNLGLSFGDELIGYFVAEQAGPDITLMNICVHPSHQHQGHAKRLMQALIAEAKRRSAETIFLEVRASNQPAIGLYHAMGFAEMGVRKNYYPTAEGREDALLMGLSC